MTTHNTTPSDHEIAADGMMQLRRWILEAIPYGTHTDFARRLAGMFIKYDIPIHGIEAALELLEDVLGRPLEDAGRTGQELRAILVKDSHDSAYNHEFTADWTFVRNRMPAAIRRLVELHERCAHKSQPELALNAALACFTVVLMRRYRTAGDAPLALYQLGIADTGEGKEMGRRLIRELATASGHGERIVGEYKSASAIQWALQDAPGHLSLMDEFGKYLALTKKEAGAHAADVIKGLMELSNPTQGEHKMGKYSKHGLDATQKKALKRAESVYAPTIGIYAVTTPSTLFESLTSDSVRSGLINRFLVIVSCQPPQARRWDIEPMQADPEFTRWAETAKGRWAAHFAMEQGMDGMESSDQPCDVIRLRLEPGARTCFQSLDDRKTAYVTEQNTAHDLLARTVEKAERIATIAQLAENPMATHVSRAMAEWGCALAWACDITLLREAAGRIADNEIEGYCKRVLRIVKKHPGIRQAELTRKTQWLKNGQRADVLSTLIESEQVTVTEIQLPNGRPAKEYFPS